MMLTFKIIFLFFPLPNFLPLLLSIRVYVRNTLQSYA